MRTVPKTIPLERKLSIQRLFFDASAGQRKRLQKHKPLGAALSCSILVATYLCLAKKTIQLDSHGVDIPSRDDLFFGAWKIPWFLETWPQTQASATERREGDTVWTWWKYHRESTQIGDPLKCTGKGIFNYMHQHSYDFTSWQLHIERHPQGRNIEQILCFLWFSSAVITCCPFILLSYRAFSSYIILAVGNGRLVAWECDMLIVWRSLFSLAHKIR